MNSMIGILRRTAAVLGLAAIAACGGGGPDAGTPPFGGGGGAPTAADLSLVLNKAEISNTGSDTVTATVTAVDSRRNAIANIPVSISVDEDATVQVSGNSTADDGTITGTIRIGARRANRVITIRAISGEITRTVTLQVTGSRLSATPVPAVLAPGGAGRIQYRLADANSTPMVGERIVVTGPDGVETEGTTGASGDFEYGYTAPAAAGNAGFRASAAGTENNTSVVVQAGPGAIPPAAPNSVRSASVRANPSVVTVNSPGSSTNFAEVRALFVGDANAPIANVRVRFDLDGDRSSIGGTFDAGTNLVYSNSGGTAVARYIPAQRFSPTDKVTIRACWDYNDFAVGACPNASTTTVTVISDALSVAVGTDNLIIKDPAGLIYRKRFVVQVNDSSGLAKADVLISPLLDLTSYGRGFWTYNGSRYVQTFQQSCPNEDLNRNGVSEIYSNGGVEDANNSYNNPIGTPALDPPKAAVIVYFEGSNRTNSRGQVVLVLEYAQIYASWIEFNLITAASGVAGTEGRANFFGWLPVSAEDVETESPPAFVTSPWGTGVRPLIVVTTPDGSASQALCQ